ncbi:apoptosis facilitator Bcl-2-like protein 14 [Artibeus jamaicensis]|uniref:apoptosis facilitator Bcl-2-like protein 14 n=1 Tax=Artibeus jamaicensis TaxID=9417 RepID=UPI00235AC3C5|nr:apoptosis facilitator Bcl-2-like protein 14 [Artibeus jamaicensis]XP_053518137.1 apoptosis facilitator Bcl-2-like protein 14 [Artibeus jamaicensis]
MCTPSACDLEEIPLEEDDTKSIEFQILEHYAKQHVFKTMAAVSSPKLLRTRSLSQKVLGSWTANESWTQVSWPCRSSQSSEKPINLAKKKSSWRTLFEGAEAEAGSQSSTTETQAKSRRQAEFQGGCIVQQGARSSSKVEEGLQAEAVDPKVASIANRVAEIVYSWPPPEEHIQGGNFKSKRSLGPQAPLTFQSGTESAKKDAEDQIIARIVELLKYSGDQMEMELKKDKTLMNSFPGGLSYPIFKTITDQFLRGIDTRGESEVKAQGFKVALAIDVTAKLTAIDNHPMNKVLGFGTKYLKEHFSPWIQQHGGWEKVLGVSHEEID